MVGITEYHCGVKNNGVLSRELLHEEEECSNEEGALDRAFKESGTAIFHGKVRTNSAFSEKLETEEFLFGRVGCVAKPTQRFKGFRVASLGDEPDGRLGKKDDIDEDKYRAERK